jgi:hypothetical protein
MSQTVKSFNVSEAQTQGLLKDRIAHKLNDALNQAKSKPCLTAVAVIQLLS